MPRRKVYLLFLPPRKNSYHRYLSPPFLPEGFPLSPEQSFFSGISVSLIKLLPRAPKFYAYKLEPQIREDRHQMDSSQLFPLSFSLNPSFGKPQIVRVSWCCFPFNKSPRLFDPTIGFIEGFFQYLRWFF